MRRREHTNLGTTSLFLRANLFISRNESVVTFGTLFYPGNPSVRLVKFEDPEITSVQPFDKQPLLTVVHGEMS